MALVHLTPLKGQVNPFISKIVNLEVCVERMELVPINYQLLQKVNFDEIKRGSESLATVIPNISPAKMFWYTVREITTLKAHTQFVICLHIDQFWMRK